MRLGHVVPFVAALAIAGCASGTAATTPPPHKPDQACAAALKAEHDLQWHQGADQTDESAIDQDFLNFAGALGTAAQHETNPAAAKAMSALANDYTALVQSQSGAAQLPDVNTVSADGAAFDKACS